MYNWPKDLDKQNATYKSEGVHKNRDATAKMQVDAKDRNGVTDSEKKQAQAEAAAAATAKNLEKVGKGMAVDEKIGTGLKDATQEQQKAVNKTSAANISRVKAGQMKYIPTPMSGTQASYGDGVPGGVSNDEMYSDIMSGAASGYASGGGQGAMAGGMNAGMAAGASQIGQDIAAMDDEVDQATEALFQDDSVGEAHRTLGEKLQGR